MSDSAIGLIETRGLIGVLEAADTAAKAADVQLLGIDHIGGGLVSVRFRGDTASVQTAVSAASEAVRRVSELISAHVIPSPAIDVEGALRPAPPSSEPQSQDLGSLPVARLRRLARKTPGVPLQGRQISRANKDQLLEALRAAHGGDVAAADKR
jgi:microcompartment protein CcmL/EutN